MADRHIKEQISLRIDNDLLEKLDKYSESRGLYRTTAINLSVSNLISSKECILCGTENPGVGKRCSVCGAPLFDDAQILYGLGELSYYSTYLDDGDEGAAIRGPYLPHNLCETYIESGLKIEFVPHINRKVKPTEYICQCELILKDNKTRVLPKDGGSGVLVTFPHSLLLLELVCLYCDFEFGKSTIKSLISGKIDIEKVEEVFYNEYSPCQDMDFREVSEFLKL